MLDFKTFVIGMANWVIFIVDVSPIKTILLRMNFGIGQDCGII